MKERSGRILPALAAVPTALAYVGTLGYQFVYDDLPQIVENQNVQSWHYLGRYFTRHLWSASAPESIVTNYYRPVFLIWFLLNHTFFGLHPLWWHLTTVAAHVAVTILVYLLALRFTGDRVTACVAAVIFGLHPIHIECVAWISGVSEPLLGLLFVSSFLCYMKGRKVRGADEAGRPPGRVLWTAVSVILYALALLAKETAIVFPAMIVVYEWMFRSERDGPARAGRGLGGLGPVLRSAVPFLVPTVLYLIARGLALKALSIPLTTISRSTVVWTWPSLIWFYVKLLVYPVGLSVFYDTPYVTAPDVRNFGIPILAIALSALALWWLVKKVSARVDMRVIRFMLAWIVLPMVPLFDIRVFRYGDVVHDRYLYLPSIGFSIIAAILLRRVELGRWRMYGQPGAQVAVVAVLVCLLGAGTAYQSRPWASSLLLYYHGINVAPRSDLALNNLGTELKGRGLYGDAISIFTRVTDRNPTYRESLANLGFCYYELGKYEAADPYLTRAIEIDPRYPDQYICLGLTRRELHRLKDAEALIRRAIEIQPDRLAAHRALGVVLEEEGDLAGALIEFKTELAYHPDQTLARDQIVELEAKMAGMKNQ